MAALRACLCFAAKMRWRAMHTACLHLLAAVVKCGAETFGADHTRICAFGFSMPDRADAAATIFGASDGLANVIPERGPRHDMGVTP